MTNADPEEFVNPFEIADNMEEDGSFREKKYKLTFSPDIIYGTAGYDALYGGVQGVTQMMFSDVLGNHQIFASTNLLIDLRNSNYFLQYAYLAKRIDYSINVFHISQILTTNFNTTYFRFRNWGVGTGASIPLDKFRRFDVNLSLMSTSQANITLPQIPATNTTFLYPTLTYTRDVTIPGFLTPKSGTRYAISFSGAPGGLSNVQFGTILGDFRQYLALDSQGRYTFALRGSGAYSFGQSAQMFYASGVSNWINNSFDPLNGFPITDANDFVFATPVLPIRGAEINTQQGNYFGLINAEFRFPLFAALLPGPIPLFPLYNLQGTAFVDAGTIRGGEFGVVDDAVDELRFFGRDDVLVGMGFGVRTIMIGYPIRLDWAWPYNGEFGNSRFYFSIGFDF